MSFWSALADFGSSVSDTVEPWANFADSVGSIATPLVSLYSSSVSGNAAQNAANAQAGAANNAAEAQWNIHQQNRQDFQPYRDVGSSALYNIAALQGVDYEGAPGTTDERMQTALNRFVKSPAYQFNLTQGIQGLDRSSAAKGRLQSGAHDKAVINYASGMASNEFDKYQNRLASLAGVGQSATGSTAVSGQNAAAGAGAAMQNAGTARASGYVGQANATNNNLSNLMYLYG